MSSSLNDVSISRSRVLISSVEVSNHCTERVRIKDGGMNFNLALLGEGQ